MRRQIVQGDLGQILMQFCRHMVVQGFGQMREHIAKHPGAEMEPQIWSTDAAGMYFELHKKHYEEVMPLVVAEMADGRAVEAKP